MLVPGVGGKFNYHYLSQSDFAREETIHACESHAGGSRKIRQEARTRLNYVISTSTRRETFIRNAEFLTGYLIRCDHEIADGHPIEPQIGAASINGIK
jgi:hypothetical protein